MTTLNLDHTNRDAVNFDVQETAELLKLTTAQVHKLIKQSKVSAFKCGSAWWITRESIERLEVN